MPDSSTILTTNSFWFKRNRMPSSLTHMRSNSTPSSTDMSACHYSQSTKNIPQLAAAKRAACKCPIATHLPVPVHEGEQKGGAVSVGPKVDLLQRSQVIHPVQGGTRVIVAPQHHVHVLWALAQTFRELLKAMGRQGPPKRRACRKRGRRLCTSP
jgi:hypothetical protein